MGRLSDSFTLLQRLARTFAELPLSPGHRRSALLWARALGATAVPMSVRELIGPDEARTGWAFAVLVELADGGHRERVCEAMREIAASDASDEAKLRALALLSELGADQVPAQLRNPQAARARSMRKLAASLSNQADVAQAASMLAAQLGDEELAVFLRNLRDADARGGAMLASELLVRDDLVPGLRAELEHLVAGGPRPIFKTSRAKRHVRIARHPDGHTLLIAWARRPRAQPTRYRSASALITPSGTLLEFRYGDDATSAQIDRGLLGSFLASGFVVESDDHSRARRLLLAAIEGLADDALLPAEFYLGRDLFDLGFADHLDVRPTPTTDLELLVSRGFEAYRDGHVAIAETLFERILEREDSGRARAGLGLCALARGDLDGAEAALREAANAEPECAEHLWNLGAVAHRRGCRGSVYLALSAFAGRADASDPRLAHARAFVSEFERHARLLHPDTEPIAVASADRDLSLGLRAMASGDLAGAEGFLVRAATRVPSHYAAWTELAQLRSRLGQLSEAKLCARRALVANPTYELATQVADVIASAQRYLPNRHQPDL